MNTITSKWLRMGAAFAGMVALVVGGLLVSAQSASATDNGPTVYDGICMQKVFGGDTVTSKNRLNCSAGDIRLSRVLSVSPTTCTRGQLFDLTATFEIIVTANARYDAGFFFRLDGGPSARGGLLPEPFKTAEGSCSLSALTPPSPTNGPSLNLDGDTCGDLNSGTYQVSFTIPNVSCNDTNDDKLLNLPYCTSWHSKQGTLCEISSAGFVVADAKYFAPDTPSKCVCDDTFQVPVLVEEATIEVTKTADPMTVPEPGGEVTYTVSIKNTASLESVAIYSIIDNIYGDLGDKDNEAVTDNGCPDLIGDTLGAGLTTTCSFKGYVSGNATDRITDTVEVTVYQASTQTYIDGSDEADVDITDVYTGPTMTKTAQSTANCELDAVYQVVVSNNSLVDSLEVNSLTDSMFGDITKIHGADTDCGGLGACEAVLQTSCAALPTLPGSGILPGKNFTCTFKGRIVSDSCDISHTNKVTAVVTDDDGKVDTLTDDAIVSVETTP
jgi:hypothetical protein